jgi:hypothetical protein
MKITQENMYNIDVIPFLMLYTQLLYGLSRKRLNIFGSTIRNWIIPCYYHDLSPTQYETFHKLLELQPEINITPEIDVWVELDETRFKTSTRDIQSLCQNLGYAIEYTKITLNENIRQKYILLRPKFSRRHSFSLRIHGAQSFMNVDFDVNNLYVKCDPDLGISQINFLSAMEHPPTTTSFGYLVEHNKLLNRTIQNIMFKQCLLLPFEATYPLNKEQLLINTEKIINNGFRIMNHSALLPAVVNTLKMNKCSICLEEIPTEHYDLKYVETYCQHVYHTHCVFSWWRKQQGNEPTLGCPNCRTSFTMQPT